MEASTQESQQQRTDAVPDDTGPQSKGLRLWSAVFPEPMGVALVATLVVGLAGLSVYAHYVLQDQR